MTIPRRRRARQISLRAILLLALATVRCSAGWSAGQGSAPLPKESAGVFIGVEKFAYDFSLLDVRYAVNDAVDLAYALSIERNVLPANHVLLLLAGDPIGGSRDRLDKLIAAGVRRQSARQADIYSLVKEQSKLVKKGGILVLSISTHGFSQGGEQLLMAEDSLLEFGTGVTAANLLQATQPGSNGRRLLLLDACREQLVRPSRRSSAAGTEPDPRSAMRTELIETLAKNQGYAVYSAASNHEYAYSGGDNGFFTGAVVGGLRCRMGEQVKTLRGLASLVNSEVEKQSPSQHPELIIGGGVDDFVLFDCNPGTAKPEPKPLPAVISPDTLEKIQYAKNFLAVGGPDNVEQSFRLYRQAFSELPPAILKTLNQGLLARARQLEDDSRADEGARIYEQLLTPLIR